MEKLFVYTDSVAKIDTQLHTEVMVEHTEAKVKEIFKVFLRSINYALNFNYPIHSD